MHVVSHPDEGIRRVLHRNYQSKKRNLRTAGTHPRMADNAFHRLVLRRYSADGSGFLVFSGVAVCLSGC